MLVDQAEYADVACLGTAIVNRLGHGLNIAPEPNPGFEERKRPVGCGQATGGKNSGSRPPDSPVSIHRWRLERIGRER